MSYTKGFYSTTYKEFVNIRYPHIKNLLNHEIIFRKNTELPELIIPNIFFLYPPHNLIYYMCIMKICL
jgi:hypothetical protein